MGQTRKYSLRADVFRFSPDSRHFRNVGERRIDAVELIAICRAIPDDLAAILTKVATQGSSCPGHWRRMNSSPKNKKIPKAKIMIKPPRLALAS
jgi:hypothetical protein